MARESFESEEAAALLNAHFVAVKVDREERPDIDAVYMGVCQAMTGSGGWPLTIVMTPDKKPFFAGTYLPLRTQRGRVGLVELLTHIAVVWRQERAALADRGGEIAGLLGEAGTGENVAGGGASPDDVFAALRELYDSRFGGFSYAPKFPMPHFLLYLLADWKAFGRRASLDMARATLTHMYRGGLFDHAGGGFSRYSTDEKWLVPHFEKMLYDNALLLKAYAQGYAAAGDEAFAYVAHRTAGYLMRGIQTEAGGYASAEDADSEGVEGKYYVWAYDELQAALTPDELERLETRYGVTPEGNFEGKTILNRIGVDGFADEADERVLRKLFERRRRRVPPFRDTKISAAWNGLAIQGMAEAGLLLRQRDYIGSAEKAAGFVMAHMTDGDRFTCGTYMNGPGGPAFLADYAHMAGALIALYKAARRPGYLQSAIALAREMLVLFRDGSGFSMTPPDSETLFMRPRDDDDGASPSGGSGAVKALVELARITGDPKWRDAADSAAAARAASPVSRVYFQLARLLHTTPHRQVVIVAAADSPEAARAYDALISRFDPLTTVVWHDGSAGAGSVPAHAAAYEKGAPFAAYVCEDFACRQPVYSSEELLAQFD